MSAPEVSQGPIVEPLGDKKPTTEDGAVAVAAPPKNFTLTILPLIKTAQIQNGLRHNDYERYREFCSRRLRRIRKKLKWTHGRGRFQKKALEPRHVTDNRFLEMTLMQAERSWAYAMELREQQASSRTKFHAMSRLKKSVKWSKILLNLTEQTADPRTKLEAQAYANWMSGNLLREHEQWKDSVEQLVKARTIYQQLSKVASADQSELYNHRCEEIETIIKFCQYNLGGASDADIRKIVFEDPVLKQQLDHVLEETRKKQTESFEEITWLGDSIPIRNVKLRGAIVSIKDIKLELGVQDSVDKKISLYDKLFSVFSEAQKAAKDEQTALETQQKSQKSDLLKKQLQQVNDYINYERLSSMSDRNMMLAEALEKKIDDLGFDYALKQTADESRQISGFYETLMQLLTESDNLLPRDAETNKQFEAKMFSFKALRCLYLSLQYVQAARWSEASALFERSLEHSDHALSLHGDCKNPDKNLLKKVERLQKQIQGWTCYLKARVFMDTKASPKAAAAATEVNPGGMLANLNKFDASYLDQKLIVDYPPDFEPISCKPVLFDLALSTYTRPDLTEKKKAPKSGFFSSFWS